MAQLLQGIALGMFSITHTGKVVSSTELEMKLPLMGL
jgi:hypothetical protein